MKPSPHSLRSKLLTVILLCWVVPVMVLIALTVLFVGQEYRRTARSILETDAAGALQQTKLLFSQTFAASKEVTYEGTILSAYRAYQDSGDGAALYRTATDYLAQKYSRDESLKGVCILFQENGTIVPYTSAKGSVSGRLSSSFPREVRQELSAAMAELTEEDPQGAKVMAEAIKTANGMVGVDGVAGATMTSKAIRAAVNAALAQGK